MELTTYNNSFLSITENIQFSKLRGLDLQELLYVVENFEFNYRNNLDFSPEITFGCELEYEFTIWRIINHFIKKNYPKWKSKKDNTCILGGEIASRILNNDYASWTELKNICQYLKEKKVNVSYNASNHIHVSIKVLNDIEEYRLFLKLWGCYEYVFFRFGYGDKIGPRKEIRKYACPIADLIKVKKELINETNDLDILLPNVDRYEAVNFITGKDTLEYRLFNGTYNEVICQNNINTAVHSALAPSKGLLDGEYLDYKLQHEFISSNSKWYMYNEVHLKGALELVDFIFDNNLDKVYFFRQYLKLFQSSYKSVEPIADKTLIKKY